MREPRVDDRVRLTHDMPELCLCRGTIGIVRSTWFAPAMAYEVEFQLDGMNVQTRALLLADQLEIAETDTMVFDDAQHAVGPA